MLSHMLHQHPQIACYGELMRKTQPWMLEQGYRGALRHLDKVDPKFKDDDYRFSNPYEFIEAVYSVRRRKKPVRGFKLHVDQHRRLLSSIVENPEYALILLTRENELARYSSQLIAENTGQGSARKGDKIKRVKVPFDRNDFLGFVKRSSDYIKLTKELIAESGKPVFEIRYLELTKIARISELIRFLGADDRIVPEPVTLKRNSSSILERFSNPELVLKVLEEIGHQGWRVEDISDVGDSALQHT